MAGCLAHVGDGVHCICRTLVWEHPGVADCVFRVAPSASSPVLYRSVFAIWTLSFDKSITASLKTYQVVQKIKAILTTSRIEKVGLSPLAQTGHIISSFSCKRLPF